MPVERGSSPPRHRMIIAAALWLAAAEVCRPISLKTAPVRVLWRTASKVREIYRAGNTLVIQNLWGVSAVDADSGAVLWSYHLKNDSRPLAELAVLSDRVAVVDFNEIIFFALRRGEEIHRTKVERFVARLAGPPLIAVMDNYRRVGSTMFALNPDGSIAARRIVRHVHLLTMSGDVAVAQLDRNPGEEWPTLYKLQGFDAVTLQPLWQIGGTISTEIQEIGGRPHIIETPWGENPRPIDIRTGRLGPPIPKREGRDEIWAAATWEFETPTSTPGPRNEYASCERARRNDPAGGRPKWSVDLPFAVTATLRDGETFYMFGSADAQHHFLVAVDWSSGRLLGAWSGMPDIHTMVKFKGRIIGGTFDELMSVSLQGERAARSHETVK